MSAFNISSCEEEPLVTEFGRVRLGYKKTVHFDESGKILTKMCLHQFSLCLLL